jgi:tetratricopeptide (TPR) repeat protein
MLVPDSGRRLRRVLASCLALVCLLALGSAEAGAAQSNRQAVESGKGVSSPFCRRGEALLALGRIPEAEAAFEKEMELGSSVRCARGGLAKIGSERPCAVAKALLLNGEKAEANKVYLESLKTKPTKKCAKAGVAKDAGPSFKDRLKGISDFILTALGFLLLAIAAGALIILPLLWIQRGLCKCCWPVRKIAAPSVAIEKLDDAALDPKLGAGTAALVRRWIEADSHRSYLKLVSGSTATEETWVSKVAEMGEQGKIAAAVIGLYLMLLPRRQVKATGELQPAAGSGGPGISVELHRKLSSKGTAVFWADRFALPIDEQSTTSTLRKLVVPAAAWINHRATGETGGEAIAAKDAMSWALFKTGVEWQRDTEVAKAEELYVAALELDETNYGSLANLALLRARANRYPEAIALLAMAREILEEKRMGDSWANPDWYRVSYSLMAEYMNWALARKPSGREKRLELAEEVSWRIHEAIAKAFAPGGLGDEKEKWGREIRKAREDKEKRDALRDFLRDEVEPSLQVLAAGMQLARSELAGEKKTAKAVLATVEHFAGDKGYGPNVEYNLACFYAQPAMLEVCSGGRMLKRSCSHLDKAFALTNPSDRLLFVWRVRHDSTLKAVRNSFLKGHQREARALWSTAQNPLARRSWV